MLSKEKYSDKIILLDESKNWIICQHLQSYALAKIETAYKLENSIPTVKHRRGSIII